jgi:aspartate kinase
MNGTVGAAPCGSGVIVMKFGGSSVESAAAIERVAGIVDRARERNPVVVVSAMGKTTQQLLTMGEEAAGGKEEKAQASLHELREMHEREIGALVHGPSQGALQGILDCHFSEMAGVVKHLVASGEFSPKLADALASYGERLSSQLIALVFSNLGIDAVHVDARCLLVTDGRHQGATPLYAKTYARIRDKIPPLIDQGKVPVLGGFIGGTEEGTTTTLGRGGSDFSAAIIGAGVGAEEIQIWTDVDGVMTCDPKLVPEARRVKTISFAEAAELAYFGAKVLHPSTLLPAIEKNIPIVVLNSRRPDIAGTRIVGESVPCTNVIKAISCKRGIYMVNIRSTRMLMAHGFLQRIFEIFSREETAVDMLASSEVSVSATIDNAARLPQISAVLGEFADVSVERDQAIVCIVGDNLRHTSGVAARAFAALQGVNIRMISQGASLLNIGFVVAGSDVERAVKSLHQEFFRTLDPAVFD